MNVPFGKHTNTDAHRGTLAFYDRRGAVVMLMETLMEMLMLMLMEMLMEMLMRSVCGGERGPALHSPCFIVRPPLHTGLH